MKIDESLQSWLRSSGYDIAAYRERSCVYTLLSDHGPVKIGISRHVFDRVEAINRGSFVKAHIWSINPTTFARAVEQLAHRRLDAYRLDGEWFDVPVQMADRTVRDCLYHLELGHDLTDVSPEDFSRVWSFVPYEDGWGLCSKIEPILPWMARREHMIERHFAAEAASQ
ncbi:GIY-YIG nuclease family protein [Mesorhizobium sp. M0058]|uniref:GIY-YIG nuclease family protein n=1 Tax=Mesorhizobium sp. M0058 TaxID=2956865 RepID=UPI003338749B